MSYLLDYRIIKLIYKLFCLRMIDIEIIPGDSFMSYLVLISPFYNAIKVMQFNSDSPKSNSSVVFNARNCCPASSFISS